MEASNVHPTNPTPQSPKSDGQERRHADSTIQDRLKSLEDAFLNRESASAAEQATRLPDSTAHPAKVGESPAETAGDANGSSAANSSPANQDVPSTAARKSSGPIEVPATNDEVNQLSGIRLGNAHALFLALRAKHNPTANHCLKVAMTCSGWATSLRLPPQIQTNLEVGALLHDVGKIGVPDAILVKPTALEKGELVQLDRYRSHTLEILLGAGAVRELIDTVHYSGAWFDGRNRSFEIHGDRLPITARMLAIVDAYDSMTTQQAHRQALSPDQAMAELFRNAGSQFDPRLASSFAEYISQSGSLQTEQVSHRWLSELANQYNPTLFVGSTFFANVEASSAQLFHSHLIETLNEAVVFVDAQRKVVTWNRAAERMTGIPSDGACHREWLPDLVGLANEKGVPFDQDSCPVTLTLRTAESNRFLGQISSRNGKSVTVDVRIRAVIGKDSVLHGAMIVMEDLSDEVSLAERLEVLNARVAVDPLTKVANRAEIDRVHKELFIASGEQQNTYSMVICDLDFFKRINDDYGHPAGDEALMQFASLMKRHKRPGDLVGRYGGEEFVMLCVDADVNEAVNRAEEVRSVLQATPIPVLKNRCITASFGVTQLQPGDSPEAMLRRADRALLKAKETGRNRVVSIGGVQEVPVESSEKVSKPGWFGRSSQEVLSELELTTAVPLDLAVEKLRGFVADRNASIVGVDGNHVQFKVDGRSIGLGRRQSDRAIPFIVEMDFDRLDPDEDGSGTLSGTKIKAKIRPIRQRDRRAKNIQDQVSNLIQSLKAYFMATTPANRAQPGLERAATEPGRRD